MKEFSNKQPQEFSKQLTRLSSLSESEKIDFLNDSIVLLAQSSSEQGFLNFASPDSESIEILFKLLEHKNLNLRKLTLVFIGLLFSNSIRSDCLLEKFNLPNVNGGILLTPLQNIIPPNLSQTDMSFFVNDLKKAILSKKKTDEMPQTDHSIFFFVDAQVVSNGFTVYSSKLTLSVQRFKISDIVMNISQKILTHSLPDPMNVICGLYYFKVHSSISKFSIGNEITGSKRIFESKCSRSIEPFDSHSFLSSEEQNNETRRSNPSFKGQKSNDLTAKLPSLPNFLKRTNFSIRTSAKEVKNKSLKRTNAASTDEKIKTLLSQAFQKKMKQSTQISKGSFKNSISEHSKESETPVLSQPMNTSRPLSNPSKFRDQKKKPTSIEPRKYNPSFEKKIEKFELPKRPPPKREIKTFSKFVSSIMREAEQKKFIKQSNIQKIRESKEDRSDYTVEKAGSMKVTKRDQVVKKNPNIKSFFSNGAYNLKTQKRFG